MNQPAFGSSGLLQIGVAVIVALTLGCMAILRNTIDASRRNGRESRMGNLRLLLMGSTAPPYCHENLIQRFNEFLDSYFCSNKLLLLRLALTVNFIVAILSFCFLCFAYYLERSVVVDVRIELEKVANLNQDRGRQLTRALDDLAATTIQSVPGIATQTQSILAADQITGNLVHDSLPRADKPLLDAARASSAIVVCLLGMNLLTTILTAWFNEYFSELINIMFV